MLYLFHWVLLCEDTKTAHTDDICMRNEVLMAAYLHRRIKGCLRIAGRCTSILNSPKHCVQYGRGTDETRELLIYVFKISVAV